MRPWMKDSEVRSLEKVLLGLGKKHGQLKILEWGSGGSTVHFTDFLKRHGISYEWLSLEYNKKWHDEIHGLKSADPDTKIVLFDAGNTELKQRRTNMDDYVAYPKTLGVKYDFILVDGRKRRRCLSEAQKLLLPGGVVVLHDAERKYYHCAFLRFPYSRFLRTSLWVGKISRTSFLRKALNALINQFYFKAHKLRRL